MSYSIGYDAPINALMQALEFEHVFSFEEDVKSMLQFEGALAEAQAFVGLIPDHHAKRINDTLSQFTPDLEDIRIHFSTDGVVPPALVKQIKAELADDILPSFHLGTTSQDLIDTSLMIRLKSCVFAASNLITRVDAELMTHISAHDDREVLARTRMQNALPITVSEKVNHWRAQLARLQNSRPHYFPLQLGGPEGAARQFGGQYDKVVKALAESLDLDSSPSHWQTDRQPIMSIAFWFSQIASVIGKIATDVLMMVQSDVAEIQLRGGGTSSAMAHKQNPIIAETIVAQARFCHAQMNGLNGSSIHENERSGVAWTLEWLLLPPMIIATGSAMHKTIEMSKQMTFKGSKADQTGCE